MSALVFVSTILAIYVIQRYSVEDAVLKVYLPSLLLIPEFYSFRAPHLPPIGFANAAAIPIGMVLILKYLPKWKFQRTDLWILIFAIGGSYSEWSRTGASNGGLMLFGFIIGVLFPYMFGKLALEKDGMREQFARRFVIMLFWVAVLASLEFRLGLNVFTRIGGLFFHDLPWLQQLRGGFIRISGPFSDTELAGMVFLVGAMLSMWIGYIDKQRGNERKYFGVRRSTILTLGLIAGLLMTFSRGPELGLIFAFVIGRIGKAKNMKLTAAITLIVCGIAGAAGVSYADKYTSGSIWDAKDPAQENAIYRRQLLDNYKPIVEKGGLFGWGATDFPRVAGQNSIDNEFLLLQLTQGQLGFVLFLVISLEAAIATVRAARKTNDRSDLFFYFTIGGSIAGLLLSLTTVYMGAQNGPLFFLLVGWSQSMRPHAAVEKAAVAVPARFSFRRVFA